MKLLLSNVVTAKVDVGKQLSALSSVSLVLSTSFLLPLRLWPMNWALLVDSLPASSMGIITSTAEGQHNPLF